MPQSHLTKLDATEPSIRLLKAVNTVGEPRLCYIIRTFKLHECPPYNALSYTWGNPFPPEQVLDGKVDKLPPDVELADRCRDWQADAWPIICNGELVMVRLNLFEALHQLSKRMEHGFLWVDRLCIDQDDNLEKSRQVPLMATIYKQAITVIIWLGLYQTDAASALQVQNNFAGPIYDIFYRGELSDEDMQKHTPGDPGLQNGFEAAYLAKFGLESTLPVTWFRWCNFFRRTWFYRRWTLQETSLAGNIEVFCGHAQFNWYKLKFLVRFFQLSGWERYLKATLGSETENLPRRALYARGLAVAGSSDAGSWREGIICTYGVFSSGSILTEFLYRTSMLQCSEPRDIIFGIIGILDSVMQPSGLHQIAVDVTVDVADLYMSAVKLCLDTAPSLAILSLITGIDEDNEFGLPSWVPELYAITKKPIDRRLGLQRIQPAPTLFNAAYTTPEIPTYRHIKGRILHLRGVYLGTIAICGEDNAGWGAPFLLSMLDIFMGLPLNLPRGHDRFEATWRTIVADSTVNSRPAPTEYAALFHDWIISLLFYMRFNSNDWSHEIQAVSNQLEKASKASHPNSTWPDVTADSIWRKRLQDISCKTAGEELSKYFNLSRLQEFNSACAVVERRLFHTHEHDLGFGSNSAKLGDQVWVLENGRVPFVLRNAREAFTFHMVGECYVHGIMSGELLAQGTLDYMPLCLV